MVATCMCIPYDLPTDARAGRPFCLTAYLLMCLFTHMRLPSCPYLPLCLQLPGTCRDVRSVVLDLVSAAEENAAAACDDEAYGAMEELVSTNNVIICILEYMGERVYRDCM